MLIADVITRLIHV